MSSRGAFSTLRQRSLGLALLMSMVVFVGLCVAIYQRAFESTVDVLLRTPKTGNTLQADSDVKVRGVIIGRVASVSSSGDGANVQLAIQPDKAKMLPRNVSAQLLPKTLFGERYVSLEPPKAPAKARLASGDVITQDRTRSAVAVEQVLSDTMPVLQALHPDELAATLNSLNQALQGRGKPLGETLSQLNDYVQRMNPSLPQLKTDLHQVVGVAQHYDNAAPQLLTAMRNMTTTSRTLVDQRQNLSTMTKQLTTTSVDGEKFLRDNRKNLIQLNQSAVPTLDTASRYAPAFPCFMKGMANFVPRVNKVFGIGTNEPGLHIKLEVTPNRGKYEPGKDKPQWNDNRGPQCYDWAHGQFPQYPPSGPIKDGASTPPEARGAQRDATRPQSLAPADPSAASTTPQSATTAPMSASPDGLGLVNSPVERDFVSELLAPSLGRQPADVPQWGSLLVGPVLRGAEVSYR
jgi:virulence factor Mce-like protein